jgi:hypothetical protein
MVLGSDLAVDDAEVGARDRSVEPQQGIAGYHLVAVPRQDLLYDAAVRMLHLPDFHRR